MMIEEGHWFHIYFLQILHLHRLGARGFTFSPIDMQLGHMGWLL